MARVSCRAMPARPPCNLSIVSHSKSLGIGVTRSRNSTEESGRALIAEISVMFSDRFNPSVMFTSTHNITMVLEKQGNSFSHVLHQDGLKGTNGHKQDVWIRDMWRCGHFDSPREDFQKVCRRKRTNIPDREPVMHGYEGNAWRWDFSSRLSRSTELAIDDC